MDEKIKIIVVENDDLYRSALRDFLNSHDQLEVVGEAESGEKAIQVIREISADLVLLDLRLPYLSGQDLLHEIRKISQVKILVLTAFDSFESVDQAIKAGANGYCFKDVRRIEIIDSILRTVAGDPYVCRTTIDFANEKREEDRLDCNCNINWAYFDKEGFSTARVVNSSRAGCSLELDQPLVTGSTLLIRITRCEDRQGIQRPPEISKWTSMAEVKWCNKINDKGNDKYGVGLRYFFA
jgi:CheY-like chemotaxis protein